MTHGGEGKMNKTLAALALTTLTAILHAQPSVERMVVRQQWPWNDGIRVEFVLAGVTSEVDVAVSALIGGEAVAIPDDAISGPHCGIDRDGAYALTVVPSRVPALASLARADDLGFSLSVAPSSAQNREVLYKAFRLADNTWTDITRGEILNGDFGAFETDYGRIGNGYTSTLENVCVWTGITNDTKWATDYIVLRKIPAGRFDFSPLILSTYFPAADNLSAITYDYWIGVFPVTQAQYEDIYAKGNARATPWYGNDGAAHYYEYGNVYTNALFPTASLNTTQVTGHWLSYNTNHVAYAQNNNFLGRLYARTGVKFRLPTIFEWTRAYRAGAPRTSFYYDGVSTFAITGYNTVRFADGTTDKATNAYASALGRYRYNGGADEGPAPVGSYRPNAFGLYDMFGDTGEIMQDQYFTSGNTTTKGYIAAETMKDVGLVDFVGHTNGPDDGTAAYNIFIAGSWYEGDANMGNNLGVTYAQLNKVADRKPFAGIRLCIPEADFR